MITYAERGYRARQVGFGEKPGIVVVDFQRAFTDPAFSTGGAPLVRRAVENTARLLKVAPAGGGPRSPPAVWVIPPSAMPRIGRWPASPSCATDSRAWNSIR